MMEPVAPATVDWSSSDPSLAISPLGDLTASSPGLSTVAASMPPVEASTLTEATADAGGSWLVWPPETIVPVGAEGALALERVHDDGTVQDLTTVAGWRPADVDAGLVDVDTGDNGGEVRPRQTITLTIRRADGRTETVPLVARIDTPIEVEYYRHGGILPYVLRQLLR